MIEKWLVVATSRYAVAGFTVSADGAIVRVAPILRKHGPRGSVARATVQKLRKMGYACTFTKIEHAKRTRVVHFKREEYDIYIGRPSKWGNPFSHKEGTIASFKVSTLGESIERYREWIVEQPALMGALGELRGKTLGCWCKPNMCHGDVLVELLHPLKNPKGQLDLF